MTATCERFRCSGGRWTLRADFRARKSIRLSYGLCNTVKPPQGGNPPECRGAVSCTR